MQRRPRLHFVSESRCLLKPSNGLRLSGARKGVRCSRGLDALAKSGTSKPRVSFPVNASEDDRIAFLQSVPDDVRKPSNERATIRSVSLRVRKRVVSNTPEELIDRDSEFDSQTGLLGLVPILDSRQVELGRPTEQDARCQRRRCSRRALTSGQGLWLPGLASKSASRASIRARSSAVTGTSSSESVSQRAAISARRSRGLNFRASSKRFVLTLRVYAGRLSGRLTACGSAAPARASTAAAG